MTEQVYKFSANPIRSWLQSGATRYVRLAAIEGTNNSRRIALF